MVRPEWGILHADALNLDVLAVLDIDESRALFVFVGALLVPGAT